MKESRDKYFLQNKFHIEDRRPKSPIEKRHRAIKTILYSPPQLPLEEPVEPNLTLLEQNSEYQGIRLHSIGCDGGHGNKICKINDSYLQNMSINQKYWFSWMTTLWNKEKLLNLLEADGFNNINTEDSETDITTYMKIYL